MLRTKRPQP